MAKKSVASLRKEGGRNYAKIVKVVKSEKSGAYTFKEEMVPVDQVQNVLSSNK